jgi:hypothetical protein
MILARSDFIGTTIDWIIRQSPRCKVRNIEAIINGLLEKTAKEFEKGSYGFVFLEIDEKSLPRYIATILDIPEIKETNLSQFEYDEGLQASDVDDDERRLAPMYRFSSRYDVETDESAYHDFIDLEALLRNIERSLLDEHDKNTDCFFCVYEDTDAPLCENCVGKKRRMENNFKEDENAPMD